MITVGITGGPATGKSRVTRRLEALGAVTFSADEAARAVLTEALSAQIVATFGPEVLARDGTLDRASLGRRVFAAENERKRLERITHPPILRLLRAQIEAVETDLPPSTITVVEVPLLFEAHLEIWFERIVVVVSSESTQIERLRVRNGLDAEEARRRLAAQLPLKVKLARADEVIVNDGEIEDLYRATDRLWHRLNAQNLVKNRSRLNNN